MRSRQRLGCPTSRIATSAHQPAPFTSTSRATSRSMAATVAPPSAKAASAPRRSATAVADGHGRRRPCLSSRGQHAVQTGYWPAPLEAACQLAAARPAAQERHGDDLAVTGMSAIRSVVFGRPVARPATTEERTLLGDRPRPTAHGRVARKPGAPEGQRTPLVGTAWLGCRQKSGRRRLELGTGRLRGERRDPYEHRAAARCQRRLRTRRADRTRGNIGDPPAPDSRRRR